MKKVAVCMALFGLFLACASLSVADDTGGKRLYEQCAGCHGKTGETMALGASAKLKGQTANQILTKLNGYADGTFGGSKKAIMVSIAKKMKEEDRVKVSEYISTF